MYTGEEINSLAKEQIKILATFININDYFNINITSKNLLEKILLLNMLLYTGATLKQSGETPLIVFGKHEYKGYTINTNLKINITAGQSGWFIPFNHNLLQKNFPKRISTDNLLLGSGGFANIFFNNKENTPDPSVLFIQKIEVNYDITNLQYNIEMITNNRKAEPLGLLQYTTLEKGLAYYIGDEGDQR